MCVLRVTGDDFDPRAWLRTSGMEASTVRVTGEPRRPGDRPWEETGFTVVVSDADWTVLDGQIRDALDFVASHEAELAALGELPGVTTSLDFPMTARDAFAWSVWFPRELVRAAGRVGLELQVTFYPPADPESEEQR